MGYLFMSIPFVTVIIPVYEAERYLSACLESLLRQDFHSWECICIDDGSHDGSTSILQSYVCKDTRIKCVCQRNVGVSSTRNRGILYALGRYIAFIDADDWISNNYLSAFESVAVSDRDGAWPNLLIGSVKRVLGDIRTICVDVKYSRVSEVGSGGTLEDSDLLRNTFSWGRLFLTETLRKHHIAFDSMVRFSEDMLFNYQVLLCCEAVGFVREALYFYRTTPNSASMKCY